MGLYLNKDSAEFESYLYDDIFVDKSLLIETTNNNLTKKRLKYMCVTRPRRFGKSLALSMLNAYYSKGCDSKELFKGLKIETDESYLKHLNKHNVIWIDMAELYTGLNDKKLFVSKLKEYIYFDLKETFSNVDINFDMSDGTFLINSFKTIYSKSGNRFIFLIDEWDVIFREEEHNKKLCDEYIGFLRSLFKSSGVSNCFDLVYMTGILPIKRYSTQSTLNMFKEYNMLDADALTPYFGFTEEETKKLCSKYDRDFKKIKRWYDGYKLNNIEIYNPNSVVEAVISGKCSDYWTQTSSIEAVTNYMNYDNGELKDLITKMLAGEKVAVNVKLFQNNLTRVNSRDAALTVLIHLGYLAYDEKTKSCYIPNYEISLEFENALQDLHWDLIYAPIKRSLKMYDETLKGNTDYINQVFDLNHKDFASVVNKNKGDILSVITIISFYAIKPYYNILKEVNTTLRTADIVYISQDNKCIPLIIELKAEEGKTANDAIDQIKTKEYLDALGPYKGDVALVGIAYDPHTLKHNSKVEIIKLG